MFNYLFKSLLIATFFSVLFSCSNKEEHLKLIPKNAGIVANIDLIGLVMKAGVSNFEEYGFIKDLLEKSKNDSLSKYTKILDNPFNWGISLTDDIYVYTPEGVSEGYIAIALKLSDSDNFNELIKEFSKLGMKGDLEFDNGINFFLSQKTSLLAWDKDVALLIGQINNSSLSNEFLKEKATELFKLESINQFSSSELYQVLSKKTGDINMVANQSSLYEGVSAIENNDLIKELNGICSFGSISFEDDRVFAKGGTVRNEAFKKYETKYNGMLVDFNQDIIRHMPENHLALFGFSFNLESGFDSIAKSLPFQVQMGLSAAKPILSGFGGSFNVSLYDIAVNEKEVPSFSDTGLVYIKKNFPAPKIALGFDIKNKEAFDQILGPLSMNPMIEETGNYYTIHSEKAIMSKLYAYYDHKIGVISTDQYAIKTLSNGKALERSLADSQFGEVFQKSNYYLHLHTDLSKYPEVLSNSISELLPSTNDANKYIKIWNSYNESLEVKAINKYDYEAQYKFKEKSGNILENCIQMVDEIYQLKKKNKFLSIN
jgi:hypothetical protein